MDRSTTGSGRKARTRSAVLAAAVALALGVTEVARAAPPTPAYVLRIQAFRTANDDGSLETAITPAQVATWVAKANAIFSASEAGIALQFDPAENGPDWGGLLKDTLLNHTYNGDAAGTAHGNAVAAKYPGKLVIFFRHEGYGGNTGNGFASLATGFVALPAFSATSVPVELGNGVQNDWQMAHEVGHFLGLGHTFPGSADDATGTYAKAAAYIRDHGGTAAALDGDGIADTPAEAGTSFFDAQGWKRCSGHDTYTIAGTRLDGKAFSFTFSPARHNVMSYFACEPMTFTPGQVQKMRATLLSPSRKHLVQAPFPPDFYGVPAAQFQTGFDYWTLRGLWPATLCAYTSAGSGLLLAGSFQKGANRPVRVLMTGVQYQQAFETFRAQGFRPEQVNAVDTSGGPRYTVVWAPVDGDFQSYAGMTRAEYAAKWPALRSQGFLQVDQCVYGGGQWVAATWVKRPHADFAAYPEMTGAEYTAKFDAHYAQGLRTVRFTAYATPAGVRYAALWHRAPGSWTHWRDMDTAAFQAKYDESSAQGLRLVQVQALGGPSPRFSAVWTKP